MSDLELDEQWCRDVLYRAEHDQGAQGDHEAFHFEVSALIALVNKWRPVVNAAVALRERIGTLRLTATWTHEAATLLDAVDAMKP